MRRSPAIEASFNPDAPRLACVRPAASVHPEPGSNSPLYKMFCFKSLALISKVLFEITLLQEWKKLLAAQILQRTLFKYIAIKNNFFLFAGSVLAAFPVVPTADFSAESGAKISHLFETTKSFRKIFSEIFRTFFLIVSNRISYSKRVQR